MKNVSIQSTLPLCSSVFRWEVFVPIGGEERGKWRGRTIAPFALEALPIMAARQGKTPTFPIFKKIKIK